MKNKKCKKCNKIIKPENYIGKALCKKCDEEHLVDAKKVVRAFYKKHNVMKRMYIPKIPRMF